MQKRQGSPAEPIRAHPVDLAVFYILMAAIGAFGGSSRYDLMQTAMLQPILWVGLGASAFRLRTISGYKPLVGLIVAYGVWLAFQLIPLPIDVWSQLPGRDVIVHADIAVGSETARPFSLVPGRTLHALGYFPIFLAPVLAAINLGPSMPRHVLFAVLAIALASGLLGLLQVLTGKLYFYAITSPGRMVGLFANPNHNAVFGSFAVALTGACLASSENRWVRQASFATAGALFLLMMANGSRAGLLTLVLATVVFVLAYAAAHPRKTGNARFMLRLPFPVIAVALLVLMVASAYLMTGNLYALERLAQDDPLGDLRFSLTPISIDMAKTYFPLGAGIGTFENAFYIAEPDELLSSHYVNMAHNDLIQIVIEGGLIGVVLLVGALLIALRNFGRYAATLPKNRRKAIWLAGLGALAILLLGSAFDYPLRTPIFQASLALLVAILVNLARPVPSIVR